MTSESAFMLMAVAVTVSSLALLIMGVASLGIYRAVKKLQTDVEPLIPRVAEVLTQTQTTLSETSRDLRELSAKAHLILDSTQTQLAEIDRTRTQLSAQLKIQAERVELVLEDIMGRTQDVIGTLQSTVLRPVREVSGIFSGISTAPAHLHEWSPSDRRSGHARRRNVHLTGR